MEAKLANKSDKSRNGHKNKLSFFDVLIMSLLLVALPGGKGGVVGVEDEEMKLGFVINKEDGWICDGCAKGLTDKR